MLHKINRPACDQIFEAIQEFQRQVLEFACDPEVRLPLDKAELQTALGENGKWFWKQLHKQRGTDKGGDKPLKKWLTQLIRHLQKPENLEKNLGQKILKAFDHDVAFDQHMDEDDFQFYYQSNLDTETRKPLRKLMEGFYTELLKAGFPESIHGQDQRFDRDAFIKAFWQANQELKICPACDGSKPPTIDTKVYADADHFLPKSKYPFLSLHKLNLVPTCIYCNRTFKGDKDPTTYFREEDSPDADDGFDWLVTIGFFPYTQAAIEGINDVFGEDDLPREHIPLTTPAYLVIRNRTDAIGMRSVQIMEGMSLKEGVLSDRVRKLNEVWKLEKRWPSRLQEEIDSLIEINQEAGQTKGYEGNSEEPVSEQELREDFRATLIRKLKKRVRKIGKTHGRLLFCSYLLHSLRNNDEFESMFLDYKKEYHQAVQEREQMIN